jgi:menaquinone-dependent protoporphyrinogen IX oxidase
MEGIVLYKSKYGSTKQYAEWIAQDMGFPLIDLNEFPRPDIEVKDVVIIGGWILSNRMVTHSWIKKNLGILKKKKVILFSTSASKPTNELRSKYMNRSLPEEIREDVAYFPLWGRFETDNLNIIDRSIMRVASRMFSKDPLMKEMIKGIDGVRKENLRDLMNHIG